MKSRIEKYFLGELSGAEMNALEKEALSDPFLAEAMEGMEFSSNPSIIGDIKKDLPSPSAMTSSFWFKGLIVGAVAIGGVLLFQNLKPEATNSVDTVNEASEKKDVLPPSIAEDSEEIEKQIEQPIYLEEIVIVKEKDLPEEKFEWKEELKKIDPPEKISPVTVPDQIDLTPETPKTEGLKKLRRSNMAVNYFFDLKVIDYGKIYRKSILVDGSIESGTPASMETKSDAHGVTITFNTEKWVPYMEFLESTMEFVKEEKYKRALDQFDIIYDNFPNDGNAMFYSGLSQYHLGEFQRAIDQFDAIIDHDANTFDEEAAWYKLLSLKNSDQFTLFEDLKKEIIDGNGFYAKRAKELKL